jgi:hypothetical protein
MMHIHTHPSSASATPGRLPASINITRKAERELAAFLGAAANNLDAGGVAQASELWLQTMEHLDWHCGEPEKFFRLVTIQAIAQLAQNSVPQMA